MSRWIVVASVAMALLMSACAPSRKSAPMRPEALQGGITVVRALPKPFVGDAIESAIDPHTAEVIETKLTSVDPYRLTPSTFQTRPPFGAGRQMEPSAVIEQRSLGELRRCPPRG